MAFTNPNSQPCSRCKEVEFLIVAEGQLLCEWCLDEWLWEGYEEGMGGVELDI